MEARDFALSDRDAERALAAEGAAEVERRVGGSGRARSCCSTDAPRPRSLLGEVFDIDDAEYNLANAVALEYFMGAVMWVRAAPRRHRGLLTPGAARRFGRSEKLEPGKFRSVYDIHRDVFLACFPRASGKEGDCVRARRAELAPPPLTRARAQLSLDDAFVKFKDAVITRSELVQAADEDGGAPATTGDVLSEAEIARLTDRLASGLFRHYHCYASVFAGDRPVAVRDQAVFVSLPPRPPPLAEARQQA